MVGCYVGVREYGRELVLGGRNLIVFCFGENAELPQLFVEVTHIFGNSRLYGSEIMILKLLTFGRSGAEKSSAGENKILSLVIELLLYKEIFLFGAYRCDNS